MTEIAECTACQLIITKNPLIPLQRTLSLLSPPLLAGVVFTFHACWNSPPYGSEMHRYVVRARTLALMHCLSRRQGMAAAPIADGLINSFVLVCQHMLR